MNNTLEKPVLMRPRPLPAEPTAQQLDDFAEAMAVITPDREVTHGWLRETLLALPLPVPAEKKDDADLLTRHAVLTYRIGKVRAMLAWLVQDMRDLGYWKYPDVRRSLMETVAALRQTLTAMEAEFWRDAGALTAAEEKAIQFYYDDAAEGFSL